jgi:hypothetical protein
MPSRNGCNVSLRTLGQVEIYQFPLAQADSGADCSWGRRVPLILDRTEWDAFNILYVSVGWRGRALPLMWQMLNPGASSFAQQREVLATVAGWMPKGTEVILLGDREFGTGVLAQWSLAQGWGLSLRLRAHEYVRREGAEGFQMLPALCSEECRFWPNVAFTQKHVALALVYIWLLLWGAYAVATGQNRLVDNLRWPVLSLFQTGFRLVNRLQDWGRLSQFQWHLAILEYDN